MSTEVVSALRDIAQKLDNHSEDRAELARCWDTISDMQKGIESGFQRLGTQITEVKVEQAKLAGSIGTVKWVIGLTVPIVLAIVGWTLVHH